MTNSFYWQKLALRAIDLGRQTGIAKSLPELERSQWLPAKALAEVQISRLQQILAFASQHVPFYRRLFDDKKWDPRDFCVLSDLENLPVITKEILRSAPLDFQPCDSNYKVRYKSRCTGGSTGEPLPYHVANDAFGMWWAATFRTWQSIGYNFGDRMLTLGGTSLNSRNGSSVKQRIYNSLRNNYAIPVGQLKAADIHRIIVWLNTSRPTLLYGYPSILYLIACYIVHHQISVHPVDRVVTTSEMLFPGQRKLIEQAFHAPVFDEYGCPEASLIACECKYHQGLHYAMEICIVEVLDDLNVKVPAGVTGHLVATNLINRAMCFIRYDTGDIGAVSAERCACGQGSLRIFNLEGRTRDMLYNPEKKYIHGVEINHLVYDFPWIDRYQIIQETFRDLRVNLSVSNAIDPAEVAKFQSRLSSFTGMTVSVGINEPFTETKGKKNRLIISKIEIPDETD